MGRPREFDADVALQTAMELFWTKGYEGTSLTDLTEGMGITRPSLYGAFGNKEELFRKALARYDETRAAFVEQALSEPSARVAVERLLKGFADAQTGEGGPQGCLGINAAIACSEAADAVRQATIERRKAGEAALADRLRRAEREGDLGPDGDPDNLAQYVMTVVHGMAVQAASGAGRAALYRIVDMTMRAWPGA